MVMWTLERSPDVWVHHEHSRSVAFRDFRLRPTPIIERLIQRAPAPVVAFKPICDSHLTRRYLERHPGARAVWVYRRFPDVANSLVRAFGGHEKDILRWIVRGDWDWLDWRGEGLSSEAVELVRGCFHESMKDEEAASIVWYLRTRFYLDLEAYRKNPSRAPFTPPVPLIAQVDAVLAAMREVGLEAVLEAVAEAARATVAAARAMGLEPLCADADRSPGVTALRLPEGVDGAGLPEAVLTRSGCRIAGGQDELKGKIVRIGHMGATTPGDLLGCLAALEAALLEQGVALERGRGLAAAAAELWRTPERPGRVAEGDAA